MVLRMNCSVKMNRNVDADKDYISPGGYIFTMGGKAIPLDFVDYSIIINKDDPSIVHIEGKNPDIDVFPQILEITPDMLENISEIPDFFVFTGENDETNLAPVKLLNCRFCLHQRDWMDFPVPTSVCKKAKLGCCIMA